MRSKELARNLNQLWSVLPEEDRLVTSSGDSYLRVIRGESFFKDTVDKTPQLDNWIEVLDHILSWFTICTLAFGTKPAARDKKGKAEFGAFVLVLGTVLNHAIAIQSLCTKGFDVPAKQVLRSMLEYIELLMLFEIKPELMLEFNLKQDVNDSNSFWHAHLSKGKARKSIEAAQSEDFPEYSKEMRDWWTGEKIVLGAAAHPSLAACFAAYTSMQQGNITLGFLGKKSSSSIRTVRLLTQSLFELAVFAKSLKFWDAEIPNRFFPFNQENLWHRRAKASWPAIVLMMSWVLKNDQSVLFSTEKRPRKIIPPA